MLYDVAAFRSGLRIFQFPAIYGYAARNVRFFLFRYDLVGSGRTQNVKRNGNALNKVFFSGTLRYNPSWRGEEPGHLNFIFRET